MFQAPTDCHGCPEVFDQTLVTVDCGCEDRHDIWQTLDETSEEVAAKIGKMFDVVVRSVGVGFAACEKVLLGIRIA